MIQWLPTKVDSEIQKPVVDYHTIADADLIFDNF